MTIPSTLLLVLLSATSAADLRSQGLQFGYNLDYEQAVAAFKAAIAADPNDPAAYRLLAATAWIRELFEQGAVTVEDYLGQARATVARRPPSPVLDAEFHDAIRRATALADARLRDRPWDADAHFQVGAAYGVVATYTASVNGRIVGSLGAARRAYREHIRTLELDPARGDAELVPGLYGYTIASLSAPLRMLARLGGFSSDRERALRHVEAAARYPSDSQPNALFTLILIYNREGRPDAALATIGELRRRFPRNRLLCLEAANTALRAGRAADALRALDDGFAMLALDRRPRAFGEESRWELTRARAIALSSNTTSRR
jgi:tetratricopeptide (TPR) repeat protein